MLRPLVGAQRVAGGGQELVALVGVDLARSRRAAFRQP